MREFGSVERPPRADLQGEAAASAARSRRDARTPSCPRSSPPSGATSISRFDPARVHVRPPDRDRLAKIFTELEFTKFLQDLDAAAPKKLTISYEKYRR